MNKLVGYLGYLLVAVCLLTFIPLHAQDIGGMFGPARSIVNATTDPVTCQPVASNVFFNTSSGLLKLCTATNTWSSLPSVAAGGTGPYTVALVTATSSAPSAALAGAGAGNVDNGTHVYQETCITATGETSASASSGSVNVADKTVNGKITVTLATATPCLAGLTTGRNLYRSKAGTTTPLFLVAASPVVADNTTATYTDNLADASLQAGNAPITNSTLDPRINVTNTGTMTLATSGITFQGVTGTNVAGVPPTVITPAAGTGNAVGDQFTLNRTLMLGTGSTAHTAANAAVICESKTLSNTSATTTTIANIGLASNSAGGLHALITLTASDGTNFDSETQDVTVSYVNKAGVITVGTPLITTSTAANNSGSATIGATVTGASPTISLKVTPVFGTIVPTAVTSYVEVFSHGAGAVTCQ